jgi:hypothetical protein
MSESKHPWLPLGGMSMLCLGILLTAFSFIWKQVDSGKSGWSPDDAVALQESALRVHELSSSVKANSPPERKQEFSDVALRVKELQDKRDKAISAIEWRKQVLRWGGIGLGIAGLLLYFASGREST